MHAHHFPLSPLALLHQTEIIVAGSVSLPFHPALAIRLSGLAHSRARAYTCVCVCVCVCEKQRVADMALVLSPRSISTDDVEVCDTPKHMSRIA